jgi:hypothetical protein
MNAIQKPLSGLKNVLQKPHEEFQGLLSFMQNLMWTCCSILPSITDETRSRKSTRVKTMRVHSAVSRGRLMQ